MKRFWIALTALLLLMGWALAPGLAEEEADAPGAMYDARAWRDFHIRREPGSGYQVIQVKTDAKVTVLEYGDERCRVRYKGYEGYCKTEWLWGFHSLDAQKYPVPGHVPAIGAVLLREETWIEGGEFSGVCVAPGSMVCVSAVELDYVTPVWRGTGYFSVLDGDFCPFAPWQDAQPGDMIAGFTTYYNEASGGDLAGNRADNIRLGCARVQGTVIAPGEQYSFNVHCAPYTQENGYLMAPNISQDGKGFGGGVCQVSTTLYNAVLGLPLQVDKWSAHRRTGVYYIPISLDSAVGTYTDLCFTNTLPYPILLWAEAQDGAVTVLIYRMLEPAEAE